MKKLLFLLALGAAIVWVATTNAANRGDSQPGSPGEGGPSRLIAAGGLPTPESAPTYDPIVRRSDGGPVAALKDPKLDSNLVLLVDAAARAEAAGQRLAANTPLRTFPQELEGMIAARELRLTDGGEVQVYIIVDDTSVGARKALEALGARIEQVEKNARIVQAQVPTGSLRQIADLPGVRTVRLPDYGFVQAGSVTTEGDAVMGSDNVRTTYAVDGTGVKVGVISNGVGGLSASQGSADLPAVDTATCNITAVDPTTTGAEGTAMLEIVHDIAPGASLMFGNFSTVAGLGTTLEFNAAVNCLANNADVVVEDIGWFGVGPYDGTSLVSVNSANALNGPGPIKGYYNAVANHANKHYQGSYVDSGFDFFSGLEVWDAHEFDVTGEPKGTKNALGTVPLPFNRIKVDGNKTALISLVWSDPWGTSSNDYDLFIGDGVNISPCRLDVQDGIGGNDYPTEFCAFTNVSNSAQFFDIFIGNRNGAAAPVTFDLFCITECLNLGNGNNLDFNTEGSSVPNGSDAGGTPVPVVSVGAVRHSSPNTIEPVSSRGLTEDGRLKPDVVAPDGVSVTGNGGFGSPFLGTSAAAPHVAGVAALLVHCDPNITRIKLHKRLLEGAIDLGAPGQDNVFGNGRVNAFLSAPTYCGNPTPTPQPTPTKGLNIGVMSFNVKGAGVECDDPAKPSKCDIPIESQFTLSVSVNTAPADGYITFQTWINYGGLTYKKAASAADEIVWPDCAILAIRSQTAGDVNHSCTTDFPSLPTSTFEGNVVEITLNCSPFVKSFNVALIPPGDLVVGGNGTGFLLPDGITFLPAKTVGEQRSAGYRGRSLPPWASTVSGRPPPPRLRTRPHTRRLQLRH